MAETEESKLKHSNLRKRLTKTETDKVKEPLVVSENDTPKKVTLDNTVTQTFYLETGTYWLTRIVILRYLGFIYLVAFLVALHQNKQLLGSNGLLPAHRYLNGIHKQEQGLNLATLTSVPSIVWLFNYEKNLDSILDYIAYGGLGLSAFVIINGGANWFILSALWVLYHSLVNIGQTWYSFGWESQILETGFLAIFLCPMLSLSSIPRFTPTSRIVIWGYRWLIFRIMLGAGLIKIRGDKCWMDLTCMNYHYETQPVPNPLSYYMHQSPVWFHKFETLTNHFVELVAPPLLLLPAPRRLCMIGGFIQILFQDRTKISRCTIALVIVDLGYILGCVNHQRNLSFLNWLTIVPSLACFDDASVAWMFKKSVQEKVSQIQAEDRQRRAPKLKAGNYIRRVFNIILGVLIAYLSIPVVQNLMSSRQHMNTSFEPLRLVNTYGAFGSVTKERTEVIYQGTYGDPKDSRTVWEEYEFKCKPGKITRRPCIISPYHYRLDWLLWFAAFQNYQYNPWMITLTAKLLSNDNTTLTLIAHNPFEGKDPPEFIRVQHYSYKFTKIGSNDAAQGRWWKRRLIGQYLPAMSLQSVKSILQKMQIDIPMVKTTKRKQ